MKKKFFYLIFFIIFQMPLIIFADDDNSYEITANILNSVLDIVAWLGYAIALGILIWIGIKYMLSGANERAKLKGTATMYLIGVALIVLCSTIASGVAELANKDGKTTAEGIVKEGFQLVGITLDFTEPTGDIIKDMENRLGRELNDVEKKILEEYQKTDNLTDQTRNLLENLAREEGVIPPTEEEKKEQWVKATDKLGNTYYVPTGVEATHTNKVGGDPKVTVPQKTADGRVFKHWIVKKKYGKGQNKGAIAESYIETDREITLSGSDSAFDNGLYDYEIYAVYEKK